MPRFHRQLGLLWLMSVALVPVSASAQNIVSDPGFEQAVPGTHTVGTSSAPFGDDAWTTVDSGMGFSPGDVSVGNDSGAAHSGNQFVNFSAIDSNFSASAITQTLTTVVGQKYDLSFYAANDDFGNFFIVQFGGVQVFDQSLPFTGFTTADYRLYTVSGLQATSSSTALEFIAGLPPLPGQPIATYLDDVNVTPESTVPEPGSLALFVGLGMAAWCWKGGVRRGRRGSRSI